MIIGRVGPVMEIVNRVADELKEKINSELEGKGAEISDLILRYDTASIEFGIHFDKKEPCFYSEKDKESWRSKLLEDVKNKFGIEDLYRIRIPLSTDESGGSYQTRMISLKSLFTGENLYHIVKKGFKQTKRYINMYLEEVERQDKLIEDRKFFY